MRKIYTFLLTLCVVILFCFSSNAQNKFFSDVSEHSISLANAKRVTFPQKLRTTTMETAAMKHFLWSLPKEEMVRTNHNAAPVLELPMPDGTTARFHVWESSIMEPGLEAKFPEMKTFAGQGIDDPYATIRFDYNPYFGFHAQVLSDVSGTYFIDPYAKGNIDSYMSYFKNDHPNTNFFSCGTVDDFGGGGNPGNVVPIGLCRGTQLYTYRLALACTGEYAVAVCAPSAPTVPATAAAMLTTVNRVDGVYEKEVSIRMVLIANNDNLIYLTAATDPYTNNNGPTMLGQNQNNIDAVIGTANYDIGHVVSTGGGGIATLRSPCNGSIKARGVTGLPFPVGDDFDIDYVAHEMGHQWGGNHTFNSVASNCGGGNRNAGTAYEVGSGTTIQGYAGICAGDDIQLHSDPHFHTVSFDEISVFVENGGASCRVVTPTGNTLPQITSMNNNGVSIPVNTPFTLSATATDADGDAITYNWEEWDLGPTTVWNGGNANATSPLFKSRLPKTTGSRTFPDIAVILANFPANPAATMGGLKGETLPTSARSMKFRLTVRDNRAGGGGVVTGGEGCQIVPTFQIEVVGTSPFTVAVPNGGESYPGNTAQTVTWNVAGTDVAPISATNVKISLSTDGGLTYPTVLLASTANDGSEPVNIPNTPTTTARIKVEAIGNIFFDVSNQNWTITAAVAGYTFNAPTPATVACSGPTTATVALATTATGGFSTPINLTASGNPAGTTVSFSPNPLAPGSSTNVTLNNINTIAPGTYNVTVVGTAGSVVQTQVISFIVSPGAAPTITTQPTAQVVCAGSDATFTAAASGTVTYQWQVSTGGGPYTNIGGATAATYTVTGATAAQNGNQYHVVVSTLCGTATSNNALLTVNSGPAITAQPQNATTCSGQNATFSVTATGAGLTYQWQTAASCAGAWADIAGATSASYTATSVTNGMDGSGYRVIISGTCPSPVTSNCATLTVGNTASITSQPTNVTVCVGSNASFTVTTTGTVTYQWQVSTGGGPFANIAGATTATLSLTAVTAAMNGNQYHVVVFNCSGTSIISNNATLTVNTPVTITAQPSNVTLCAGGAATFAVTATGSALTYQWQVSTGGGPFANIAGATSSTLVLTAVTAAMNGNQYHVVVSGPCNLAGVTSANVTLTVNTPVTIAVQPASVGVCLPLPAGTNFSITATGTGITYQWQVSTDGGITFNNITGATGPTLNVVPTAALNGNQYHVVLNGTCTTNLVSAAATLTVNAPVLITRQPVGLALCTGDDALFSVAASSATPGLITYQWQVSINGSAFVNIPGATNDTLIIPDITNAVNGHIYHVIVSGPPCGSVTSNAVTLTVNERPGVVLAASEYNNITPYVRTSLYITVSPAGPVYIYEWYKDGVLLPGVSTSAIPVDVDGFGEYEVVVTNTVTGCGTTSNAVRISDSAAAAHELFVYPNPSSGQFQVRYYSRNITSSTTHMVTVYDSKGARVYQQVYPIGRVYTQMDVKMENAAAGIYLIELRDNTGKRLATSRVIIR
jgi:hypothetical protein